MPSFVKTTFLLLFCLLLQACARDYIYMQAAWDQKQAENFSIEENIKFYVADSPQDRIDVRNLGYALAGILKQRNFVEVENKDEADGFFQLIKLDQQMLGQQAYSMPRTEFNYVYVDGDPVVVRSIGTDTHVNTYNYTLTTLVMSYWKVNRGEGDKPLKLWEAEASIDRDVFSIRSNDVLNQLVEAMAEDMSGKKVLLDYSNAVFE